jgi:hypothetical protein
MISNLREDEEILTVIKMLFCTLRMQLAFLLCRGHGSAEISSALSVLFAAYGGMAGVLSRS